MKTFFAALALLHFCGFLGPAASMERERFDNWDSILSLSDSFDVQPQNANTALDSKSRFSAPRKQFQLEANGPPTFTPTFTPTFAPTDAPSWAP
eukprot:scaffold2764_cov148-Ochromonas_danica.AAC.5